MRTADSTFAHVTSSPRRLPGLPFELWSQIARLLFEDVKQQDVWSREGHKSPLLQLSRCSAALQEICVGLVVSSGQVRVNERLASWLFRVCDRHGYDRITGLSLSCTCADAFTPHMGRFKTLESLTLQDCCFSPYRVLIPGFLAALPPTLHGVKLRGLAIEDLPSFCDALKPIRALALQEMRCGPSPDGLWGLSRLANLTSLKIELQSAVRSGIQFPRLSAPLRHLTIKTTSLHLFEMDEGRDFVLDTCSLMYMVFSVRTTLTDLTLIGAKLIHPAWQASEEFPVLERVTLHYVSGIDHFLSALQLSSKCPSISVVSTSEQSYSSKLSLLDPDCALKVDWRIAPRGSVEEPSGLFSLPFV